MKTVYDVLNYKNDGVLTVLSRSLNLSTNDAQDLFRDTLKFLWLCANSKRLLAPPRKIDEAWHIFITFTESYGSFCQDYFGRFIHHRPAINGVVPGVNEDLEMLHYNTLAEVQVLNASLNENMSRNFTSGVDSNDWCCHGLGDSSSEEKIEEALIEE